MKRGFSLATGLLLVCSIVSANTYTVTSTADSGAGTLRQAILDANGHGGADVIEFDITGGGVHTISPTSALPAITDEVTIDGYSQSGSSANTHGAGQGLNTVLTIELDGTNTGFHGCLKIAASNSVVKGLVVNRCPQEGITLSAGAYTGNRIEGNFIGTNAAGTAASANATGILIEGQSDAVVGGTTAAARNLVSGNQTQVTIGDGTNTGHVLQGNLFGVDKAGTTGLNSSSFGVLVRVGSDITIGGTTPAERNILSGMGYGVTLGYSLGTSGVTNCVVSGNFIGLDVTGTVVIGNAIDGIGIANQGNTIGGSAAGAGNRIAGSNQGAGIHIDSGHHTIIQGNFIGTDPTGTLDQGNKRAGIIASANDITVGGVGPGEANVIAFNGNPFLGGGVLVTGQRCTIRGNRIFGNKEASGAAGLAIDLQESFQIGPTFNDAGDADAGPNGLQNFPVITSFSASSASGTLNSAASTTYTIDFYATPACDASGFGEGNVYLGSKNVPTNASGNASFSQSLTVPPGNIVTATATAPDGSTSEFSQCASLAPAFVEADAMFGGTGNTNGVLEPGETAIVTPHWNNVTSATFSASGTASALAGPPGASYALGDTTALYPNAQPHSSIFPFSDNYQIQVSAPATRPSTHWDVTFTETLDAALTAPKLWKLHIGNSFTDVPQNELFYKKIETVFHNGITLGCTATQYCPNDLVPRSQMAIFLARGIVAGDPIPASGSVGGKAYNCAAGGTSLFTDVLPTDIFCKHVHFIAAQNVTLGCGAGKYCPNGNVSRIEMAAFIAKAIVAPAGGAGIPVTYGPDPVTHLSYSCEAASPSGLFDDVLPTDPFCKHVHYLRATGVVAGCSGNAYCPTQSVKRDEMAKFLGNAFVLDLNAP